MDQHATTQGSNQDAIFAFLADSAAHGGTRVKRIDTHAAAVFLAGERVLKVKRAVKFPFLDFSTLERRKTALEAEIVANRPFAPELYKGVVAIVRRGASFAIGGDGEAVEWALDMRRFDEMQTFDHLAAAGKIGRNLAAALARAVAAAHARAPVVDAAPWIAALGDYLDQNDAAFRDGADLFPAADAATLSKSSRAAFARLRPLLEARGAQGLVRRGHGDLHLGNIALIDGAPVPFDALEFDPVMASGDILYDLAFLLMDLVERHLDAAANTAFNVYLAATRRDDDLDALAALPLFMSLRAAIRAKVTAARLADAEAGRRHSIEKDAKTYFQLAGKLIAPLAPRLVAVGGLSGCGKSELARNLAPHIAPAPGAVVFRSDVERKALFGAAETDRLPQQAYGSEITTRVYAILADKARRALAAGHSVVVDAMFAREDERRMIANVAREFDVEFQPFFLMTDVETRLERVGARVNDASDANGAVARRQESYDLSGLDWMRIDSSGPIDETFARARAKL